MSFFKDNSSSEDSEDSETLGVQSMEIDYFTFFERYFHEAFEDCGWVNSMIGSLSRIYRMGTGAKLH